MSKTGYQNLKIIVLIVAIMLGVKLDQKGAHHACADCEDTPVIPVLHEEPNIVAQDRFQGKDT